MDSCYSPSVFCPVLGDDMTSLHDVATPALFKSLVSAFPFAPMNGVTDTPNTRAMLAMVAGSSVAEPTAVVAAGSEDEMLVPEMPDDVMDTNEPEPRFFFHHQQQHQQHQHQEESRSASPAPSAWGSDASMSDDGSSSSGSPKSARRAMALSKRDSFESIEGLEALLPAELVEKMRHHTIARGRRRAKQLATMTQEERDAEAIMIREKNRLSAKECRERKKNMVQSLQERVDELEERERRSAEMIAHLQKLNANLFADLQALTSAA